MEVFKSSMFTTCLNSSKTVVPKTWLIDLTPRKVKHADVFSALYSKSLRNKKNLNVEREREFASRSRTHCSAMVITAIFTRSFWKSCIFIRKFSSNHNTGLQSWDYPRWILSERADQSHLTMKSFIIQLVFTTSA